MKRVNVNLQLMVDDCADIVDVIESISVDTYGVVEDVISVEGEENNEEEQ